MIENRIAGAVSYKILHIEDDPEDAKLVSRMLSRVKSCSLEITWVCDLHEALAAAEETQYDVVLVDFFLGASTAIDLIGDPPSCLKRSAIVMLTGSDETMVDELSYNVGVDYYLSKERLEYPVLERAVRYAIRNKQQQNRIRDFSRILAHDFTNPVCQISQCVSFLKHNLKGSVSEENKEFLGFLEKASARMTGILSGLKDYSFSQDGKLQIEPASMNSIVDGVTASISSFITSKNGVVERGDLGDAMVDRRVFSQVVQNLIQNGIKYNESIVPKIWIECSRADGRFILSFHDNGIGIKKESFAKVFEPMARLKTDAYYEGTGLGLFICKEIVERHSGRIWLESGGVEVGSSTFFVELPTA